MTVTHTIIIQALLWLGAAGSQLTSVVPDKWKPVVLGAVALGSILQAKLAHKWNPDGTPASIAYVAKLLLIFLLCSGSTMAQTAPATEPIEITASAVSLPGATGGTLAATLAGTQINITPNVGIEEINLLTSGGTTNAFMAGYSDRHLGPILSKALNNSSPWLNGYNFRVGLHADVGVARISDSTGSVRQHFSGLFGGTFDYAIKGSSTWSLAVRVDDFFTKGLPHHNNLVVALGPVVHF